MADMNLDMLARLDRAVRHSPVGVAGARHVHVHQAYLHHARRIATHPMSFRLLLRQSAVARCEAMAQGFEGPVRPTTTPWGRMSMEGPTWLEWTDAQGSRAALVVPYEHPKHGGLGEHVFFLRPCEVLGVTVAPLAVYLERPNPARPRQVCRYGLLPHALNRLTEKDAAAWATDCAALKPDVLLVLEALAAFHGGSAQDEAWTIQEAAVAGFTTPSGKPLGAQVIEAVEVPE